ncbi:hypothetical protein GCM10010489_10180 [Microbacterium saperdae]|nr:hypothetical protein GCM10010489_10180 [Microbacterium saperdae]
MTIANREGDEVMMCFDQEPMSRMRCFGDDAETMPDIASPFALLDRGHQSHDADRRAFVMVLRAGGDYPELMTDIFDVIADGTRRDILQLLLRRTAEGDAGTSVSHIVADLGISQPTVSKHLKVLRDAEMVTVREDGQRRFYSLAVEPLEVVDDWLVPFLVDAYGDDAPDIEYPVAPLPDSAAHAAEVVGRAAASAKHVVATALKRLGA